MNKTKAFLYWIWCLVRMIDMNVSAPLRSIWFHIWLHQERDRHNGSGLGKRLFWFVRAMISPRSWLFQLIPKTWDQHYHRQEEYEWLEQLKMIGQPVITSYGTHETEKVAAVGMQRIRGRKHTMRSKKREYQVNESHWSHFKDWSNWKPQEHLENQQPNKLCVLEQSLWM